MPQKCHFTIIISSVEYLKIFMIYKAKSAKTLKFSPLEIDLLYGIAMYVANNLCVCCQKLQVVKNRMIFFYSQSYAPQSFADVLQIVRILIANIHYTYGFTLYLINGT